MKILIIEDDPSLQEIIKKSLEKERYVVETADNYQAALLKLDDYDYDCILLDIMLPGGSGDEKTNLRIIRRFWTVYLV